MSLRFPAANALARRRTAATVLRDGGLALGGSLVLALAAHVAVPFWPVPMTLQTLAVFLLGAFMGPGLAAASVLAYLAEGAAGLPVFAHGLGLAAFTGATGGYLVGYVPAALVAGSALRRVRGALGFARTAATLLVADALVMGLGFAWLGTLIGWDKALVAGVTPFLLGEALKIALATAVIQARPAPARKRR